MADLGAIRGQLLKSSTFKSKAVEFDGLTVRIREPNVAETRDLANKCKDKKGDIDQMEYALRAVIALTETEDGVRIFEDSDYEALANQAVADSPVTKLTVAFAELMGGGAEMGKE